MVYLLQYSDQATDRSHRIRFRKGMREGGRHKFHFAPSCRDSQWGSPTILTSKYRSFSLGIIHATLTVAVHIFFILKPTVNTYISGLDSGS